MNNRLILTIGLLILSSLTYKAQNVPPPAILIYSAPKATEIKEFISEDRTFKISFPGIPMVDKFNSGEISNAAYTLVRKGSIYLINVIEHNQNIEPKMDEDIIRHKESILNLSTMSDGKTYSKAKISQEKDIRIGDIKGKEFAYELGLKFHKVRLLYVKNKIYEMRLDAQNWNILKESYKGKVAEFEKESERFFDSFQLLTSDKK